jgi:hypothetical protein
MAQRQTPLFLLRWGTVLLLMITALGLVGPASTTQAQGNVRYFPQTGHFLGGAFRVFWETWETDQNNPMVFGYPITEEYVSGQTGRLTQYFERARFELNEQGQVVLGNLGLEVTAGRTFPTANPIPSTAQRRYVNGYIIQYGFKEIWETRGGEVIFGPPISNEVQETIDMGQPRVVQYFQRARFEYWPELPPGQRVVISSLGRLMAPRDMLAPLPPDGAPGQRQHDPTQQPPLEESINASVTPATVQAGQTMLFDAWGFEKDEEVSLWLTRPDKSTMALDEVPQADEQGSIGHERVAVDTSGFEAGVWAISAQGQESARKAYAFFRVTPAPASETPGQSTTPHGTPVSPERIPSPVGECANNAPAPAEGFQIWLSDTAPRTDSNVHLCMRLIVNQQVVTDASAEGLVHFDEKKWLAAEPPKSADGIASLKFKVDEDVTPGFEIIVDGQMTYNEEVYHGRTSFTP